MKRVTILFAFLAMFSTGAVIWQHNMAANLAGAVRSGDGAITVPNVKDSALQEHITALREQTRELPKLRNEVGQLRAAHAELRLAFGENRRLGEAIQSGLATVISKEQLRNAGYSTPEATVESFFWAMRESRLDLMLEALSPQHADRKRFEALPPETRAQQLSGFQTGEMGSPRIKNFTDFTVAEKEQSSPDTVVLSLRSSTGVKAAKYRLKRFGAEWKLEVIPL